MGDFEVGLDRLERAANARRERNKKRPARLFEDERLQQTQFRPGDIVRDRKTGKEMTVAKATVKWFLDSSSGR